MSMQHHDHDDGLVHSHAWACGDRGRPAHGGAMINRPEEPEHDDGLVHSHGWACRDRGRPAR
jgi:hypothetical protein